MSGDPSTARPGGAGFRADAGRDTGRMERAEVTGPVGKTTRRGGTSSGSRPAVKDVPPATTPAPPAPSTPAESNGSSGDTVATPPPGAGKPTEVYDQVRRQWVTVGGDPVVDDVPPAPAAEATTTSGAVVTAVPQTGAGTVRKARLTVATVDPWSVMKLSFVLSLAGAIVLLVTVWLMWLLLSNGGVFTSLDHTVGDIAGSSSSISILDIFSLRRVMGVALMLAVVQVVLVTALATLVAFLYNLASGLVGGLDVTLAEDR